MCEFQSLSSVKVESREAEIERLSGMLRGGRPPEALAAEGAISTNERMTAHLNIQVYTEYVTIRVYKISYCMQLNKNIDTSIGHNA